MTNYNYVREFTAAARACAEKLADMPPSRDKVESLRICINRELWDMRREEREALKRKLDESIGRR